MSGSSSLADKAAFAERIKLQLLARYRGATVETDSGRFALHVTASGLDTTLPLSPLQNACLRDPQHAPQLIAEYVSSVERQLTPHTGIELSMRRVLWCVRSRSYLSGLARAGDLQTKDVGTTMVAFIAEDLPGSIMRGVPADEWRQAGISDSNVADIADQNTALRFDKLLARIATIERVPADGWRMAGDPLYQGSVLVLGRVLRAFVHAAAGDVLIAAPDRGVVLAVPATQPNADRFQRRVLREWREAMNPCSHEVLLTDGTSLTSVSRRRQRGGALVLPWLNE
jgi:hypothetical protein